MLAQRRKKEALNACRALNVPPERVFFLEQPDGALMEAVEDCAAGLDHLFREFSCSQFFVPHRMEDPSDHKAARLATLIALSKQPRPLELIEYAVWCWYHWPWVALAPGGSMPRRAARRVRELVRSCRWLSGCRTWVTIADLVDEKRQALEQHVSQVIGLPEAPEAATLSSLRGGEFIERLLGPVEIFKTDRMQTPRDFRLRLNE
jgi:LmbE family N-acetylglucosaminyl deacetylase